MSAPLKQSADVIVRRRGDSRLAFHQAKGRICTLNPTSDFVWEHCTGQYITTTRHRTRRKKSMKKLIVFCCTFIVAFSVFGAQEALGQTVFCTGFSSTQECEDWCWENGPRIFEDAAWRNNCLAGCAVCAFECDEDSDCTGGVCHQTQCVECNNDSDCGILAVCQSHSCIDVECNDDSDCGPSEICNGHVCENLETPVLISVHNSRYELTSWQDGVSFDIDADGHDEPTAWTAAGSDDGFLCLDRNGNGQIDDSTELFGNRTLQAPSADPNGFWALARLDDSDMGGNGDGMISAEDTVFPELQLWFDTNHNGIPEAEELLALSLFAAAIDLDYRTLPRVDQHGNRFRYTTKVYQRDGGVRMAYDVIFSIER